MVGLGAGIGERLELAVGVNQPDDSGGRAWLHLVEGDLADRLMALATPARESVAATDVQAMYPGDF